MPSGGAQWVHGIPDRLARIQRAVVCNRSVRAASDEARRKCIRDPLCVWQVRVGEAFIQHRRGNLNVGKQERQQIQTIQTSQRNNGPASATTTDRRSAEIGKLLLQLVRSCPDDPVPAHPTSPWRRHFASIAKAHPEQFGPTRRTCIRIRSRSTAGAS